MSGKYQASNATSVKDLNCDQFRIGRRATIAGVACCPVARHRCDDAVAEVGSVQLPLVTKGAGARHRHGKSHIASDRNRNRTIRWLNPQNIGGRIGNKISDKISIAVNPKRVTR